jgi:myo-inositol 2-dehydrogenase/D-chiro-inositol 1-dehydrogenase
MQQVRVGVIGVGGMGSFHARTLAALAGVEVVAVADPFEPNRVTVAAELGCEALADPIALATRGDLDGVVIASPDETHPELAVAALGAGAFVLCEKPLATRLDDAMQVAAAELDLPARRLQMGFMREYDPAHVQLAAAVPSLGTIDHVRTIHRNANATPRSIELIVGQSLVHDVHSVRYLTGSEVTAVTVFGSGPVGDTFRHVLAVCRLERGAHAALEFDDGGFAYEVSVEIVGRDGDAATGTPPRLATRRAGELSTHVGTDWFGRFAEAYRAQDAAWIASIRAGEAVGPTAWDGIAAQAVVDAMIESLRTGRTVDVWRPPPAPG